jgi:hypothetical protein
VSASDIDELLANLKEIEKLLHLPGAADHLENTEALALSIVRKAPTTKIAELATEIIGEASGLQPGVRPVKGDRRKLNALLWRLRLALQEIKSGAGKTGS